MLAWMPPMAARAAALLWAALVLAPNPTAAQATVDIRNRTCHDNPDLAAAQLLSGMHLRIGLYAGELGECNGNVEACKLYGSISRAENKRFTNGNDFSFNTWSGYDIELIEELAVRGNFNYTIISMGGGSFPNGIPNGSGWSVGKTNHLGENCSDRYIDSVLHDTCSNYTEKAKILLGLKPSLVHMGQHGGPVDIIGQGTWKVGSDRSAWAIWSSSVVSGDTLLLTKPMMFEPEAFGADLMFKPFKTEVWVLLVGLVIVFTAIFKVTATKFKKTAMEISPSDIAYHTCMQLVGKDLIDVNQAKIKGISAGWIIFCVVIMEFWFAGLVSQLVRTGSYTPPVSWIDLTSAQGKLSLCTENAGANDLYFTDLQGYLGHSYDLVRSDSLLSKIGSVIDGRCDTSEVTREDYNKDERFQGSGKCPAVLAQAAIAKRTRGMISRRNNTCVVTGINALIHDYTIQNCTRQSNNPTKCNLFALWTKHFPDPTCQPTVPEDSGDDVALDIEAIVSPLAVLLVVTIFGAIGTFIGKRNERQSVWPFSLFLESPEAQHVRLMQKLEELSSASTALQTSKTSMKRRKSAGLSILPPPAAPPPDDGKGTKAGGTVPTAAVVQPLQQTETQKILLAQLENARVRAHVQQPTNQAYSYGNRQQGANGAQAYGAQAYGSPQVAHTPVDDNMPAGWSSAMDYSSGHTYYINHATQTTQWTAPTAPAANASPYTITQPAAGGNAGYANPNALFQNQSQSLQNQSQI